MVATGLNVDARPPVARADTLASFGKEIARPGVTQEKVTKAQTLLDERAKNPQAEGQWGRRALREVGEARAAKRFTEQSAQQDKTAFLEPHTSKEAGMRIDQITTVSSALELAGMTTAQQQERFTQMKKDGTLPKGVKDIVDLTTRATEILASDPYIEGLLEGATPQERTAFIQSLFAGNGAKELRAALGRHMAEIHEEIAGLPADQQPSVEDPNKTALESAKRQRDMAVSRMTEVLKEKTGKPLTEAQSKMLTDAMNTADPAMRDQKVTEAVARIFGVPEGVVKNFSEYIGVEKQIRALDAKLELATSELEQTKPEEQKKQLMEQQRQLYIKCAKFSRVNSSADNTQWMNLLQNHEVVTKTLDASDFVSAQQAYIENNSKINELSLIPTQSTEVSVSPARAIAEGKIVDRLDAVLGEALNDVLEGREKQLAEAIALEHQKTEKEAQEKGEKTKADDLATLHRSENIRWIEPRADKKKDVVHVRHILDDVRMLAYHGEFGERLMVMRDAGLIKESEYMATLTKINNGEESAEQAFNRFKVGSIGDRFDAIYTPEEAKTYRADLMTKYFTAQRLMKEGIRGHAVRWGRGIEIDREGYNFPERFDLNENEWVRLHGHFETEIIDSLQKSKEGQQFIEQLKAQGIIGEPSLKKWLYLLSLLFGMGLLGVGSLFNPALGVGLGAVVAGGGSLGVRQTLKHSAI